MKKGFKIKTILIVVATITIGLASCEREDDNRKSGSDMTYSNTIGTSPANQNETTGIGSSEPGLVWETNGEWIDLGLPSGLLWYSVNIGATAPEWYGCYFAWGETSLKSWGELTKDLYAWRNYKWCHGTSTTLTKYCQDPSYGYNGFTDTLTVLEPSDDVATLVLGNGARTPTWNEWRELVENTTYGATYVNNVFGLKFTADNGRSIFLPFNLGPTYANGRYMSATLMSPTNIGAVNIRYDGIGGGGYSDRYLPYSVRAVCSPQ